MLLIELHDWLKERFNKDERIILYCVVSLFIPCYMSVIFMLFIVCYLMWTKRLKECFDEIKGSKYLLIFCVLSELTSLIHQNWLGALLTIGITIIFCIIIYYMKHTSKHLFEIIVNDSAKACTNIEKLGFNDYSVMEDGSIHIYKELERLGEINRELVLSGCTVNSIKVVQENLENYFLNLTGGVQNA